MWQETDELNGTIEDVKKERDRKVKMIEVSWVEGTSSTPRPKLKKDMAGVHKEVQQAIGERDEEIRRWSRPKRPCRMTSSLRGDIVTRKFTATRPTLRGGKIQYPRELKKLRRILPS